MSIQTSRASDMGPAVCSVVSRVRGSRQQLGGIQGMLESGTFSDVLIKCGTKEWRLHKAIICPYSTYFERAFCGNFIESETNTITLHEMDPDKIDWVVKFLYLGECATEQLADPMLFQATCVQLYELGDYFDIATLRSYAFDKLQRHLHAKAIEIQRAFAAYEGDRSEPGCHFVPQAFLEALFRGIEAAFRDGGSSCAAVQDEYVFFVRHTRFWLLADDKVPAFLSRAPAFAVALWREVLDSRVWAELGALPTSCSQCGKVPLGKENDGGHWGFHLVTNQEGVVGDCEACAPECHTSCQRCRGDHPVRAHAVADRA